MSNTRKRRYNKKNAGSLWPLVIIMVAAAAVLAAIFLLPGGRAPWQELPEESMAVTTTGTTTTVATTATTATTTAMSTTTTTTTGSKTAATAGADLTGLYLDEDGMLQFPTEGRYVQAESYAAGETIPWNLLLVNDWNPLPDGYEATLPLEPVLTKYKRWEGQQIDSRISQALYAMLAAGREAGISDFAVQSPYREYSRQNKNYWNEVAEKRGTYANELAAQLAAGQVVKRPGYSEHHTGLAVDLGGNGNFNLNQKFENTAAFKWLMEHCHEYGFILRFPKNKEAITGVIYEPWHYRYVGVEAATYIMENGLCLEEYLQQTGK